MKDIFYYFVLRNFVHTQETMFKLEFQHNLTPPKITKCIDKRIVPTAIIPDPCESNLWGVQAMILYGGQKEGGKGHSLTNSI